MRVSWVVAASDNDVIGREGGLPWHVSSDLKLFKQITIGNPVIMGRKTWESLPKPPLPGRRNIVVSRQKAFQAEGADIAQSVEAAIRLCSGASEVSIIGGGEIYSASLPMTDRIYLTRIHLTVDGDTFLPALDEAEWREVQRREFPKDERDDAPFTLIVLDRIR
jgi:dihydrofolate reductase